MRATNKANAHDDVYVYVCTTMWSSHKNIRYFVFLKNRKQNNLVFRTVLAVSTFKKPIKFEIVRDYNANFNNYIISPEFGEPTFSSIDISISFDEHRPFHLHYL